VLKAKKAYDQFRKEGRILKNIKDDGIGRFFTPLKKELVKDILHQQFEDFIDSIDIEILDLDVNVVPEVFESYFSRRSPFNEGKNKYEFPDAFILEGLTAWAEQNNQKIYVVSEDDGFVNYCSEKSNMVSIHQLRELLALFYHDYEPTADHLNTVIKQNYIAISNRIAKDFSQFGFILIDENGDVEDINVKQVEVLDHDIIRISSRETSIVAVAQVKYSAFISYDDYSYATYDREDDVYYNVEREEMEITREQQVNIEIGIKFDPKLSKMLHVDDVSPVGSEIEVSLHLDSDQ